jgi:hypothetical protein
MHVRTVGGDDQPATAHRAHSDDVRVDHVTAVGIGAVENGSHLTRQNEVGDHHMHCGPLLAGGRLAGESALYPAGPRYSSARLSADDRWHQHVPVPSPRFTQEGSQPSRGSGLAEGVEALSVQHHR